jgi:hypothetical protein
LEHTREFMALVLVSGKYCHLNNKVHEPDVEQYDMEKAEYIFETEELPFSTKAMWNSMIWRKQNIFWKQRNCHFLLKRLYLVLVHVPTHRRKHLHSAALFRLSSRNFGKQEK